MRPKRQRTPAAIRIASIAMTQSIAGQSALEPPLPYWIDAQGRERSPHTLKELGGRHRFSFLPLFVRWLSLAPISNSPVIGSKSPHQGPRNRRSPERIRGRLRQYARQVAFRPVALRPPDSRRPRGPFVARSPSPPPTSELKQLFAAHLEAKQAHKSNLALPEGTIEANFSALRS